MRRWISVSMLRGGDERGRVAKAYNRPSLREHMVSNSLLSFNAHSEPCDGCRKSSHGFARLMTEMSMPCMFMNLSFWSMEEYDASMGLPLDSGGMDWSSSEGRMIRRGGAVSSGRSSNLGGVVRDRRREI